MTLERVRMPINSSEVSFYTVRSHFESFLASKCHFDPTSESKRLLKSKRHIKGVKMTLRTIVLKCLPLVKTTLLNLQCMRNYNNICSKRIIIFSSNNTPKSSAHALRTYGSYFCTNLLLNPLPP